LTRRELADVDLLRKTKSNEDETYLNDHHCTLYICAQWLYKQIIWLSCLIYMRIVVCVCVLWWEREYRTDDRSIDGRTALQATYVCREEKKIRMKDLIIRLSLIANRSEYDLW